MSRRARSAALLAALLLFVPRLAAASLGERPALSLSDTEPALRFGVALSPPAPSGLETLRDGEGYVGARSGLMICPKVGLHLRLGAQRSRLLAVYYQAGFAWGFSLFPSTVGTYSFALLANTAVLEVTLFDRLQLAVGPALFAGSVLDGGGEAYHSQRFYWSSLLGGGAMARINMVAVDHTRGGRRHGFSHGIQGHFARFDGGQFWDVALVLGYERF